MSAVHLAMARQQSTTVGDICDRFRGEVQTGPFGSQLHSSDYSPDGTPVVMPQDMLDGRVTTTRIARVDASHAKRLRQHALRRGDIAFSRRGDVARFAVITEAEEGWLCGTGSIRIRLNCPEIDVGYLRRYLNQPSVGAWLEHNATGVTMPNLNTTIVRALPLVYPPLPEQRRIAAILDQADALRAKRREALAQLDSLTQSIFIEMFGDPGPNPKSWPELQLGELIVGTPNNGIFKKNEEYGAGTPVVWVEELFKGNEIDCSNSRALLASTRDRARYGLRKGDLLFCRSSLKLAGIGYNNVYLGEDDAALFECHVIRVSPNQNRIEPRFLNYALRFPSQRQKLFKFAKTVTMTTIDQDGLLKVSVPVPTLGLQREFCAHLSAVEVVRRRQVATVVELDALFASLQHRAFSGSL